MISAQKVSVLYKKASQESLNPRESPKHFLNRYDSSRTQISSQDKKESFENVLKQELLKSKSLKIK